ncbi:MAG: DUF167 family protein [Acidimicrobiia bacterium]|nr:DUF167 family protein [Acidimicrobiia bacterium]
MEPASPVLRRHPDGVLVAVWVVPGASRSGVAGIHDGALRLRVAAPAEGGKANRAAAVLVARAFGARGGEVVSGHAARRKDVLLAGVTLQAAEERLVVLLAGC